jgi:sirohydrochlorin ferrochelatase
VKAAILVGHGSLRKASGAAMIRLAALLRKEGTFPVATAGFLNFSQPTFMDAVARCVRKGATEIFVQPYFLISGYYVRVGLPKLLAEAKAAFPKIAFHLAEAFDDHPALAKLTHKRALAADPDADALLLMAHGSPHEEANAPILRVAEALRAHYTHTQLGFMEINAPSIAEAAATLVAKGAKRIVAAPYFLQLGGHVAEDLPEAVAEAQVQHPNAHFTRADYLSYDPLLLAVVKDRLSALRSDALELIQNSG